MATIFFMNTGYQSPDYYFEWSKGCQEFKERNNMSKSFATFDIFLSDYVMQCCIYKRFWVDKDILLLPYFLFYFCGFSKF